MLLLICIERVITYYICKNTFNCYYTFLASEGQGTQTNENGVSDGDYLNVMPSNNGDKYMFFEKVHE